MKQSNFYWMLSLVLVFSIFFWRSSGSQAADSAVNPIIEEADQDATTTTVSPIRRIRRDRPGVNVPLRRFLESDYADTTDELAGPHRVSARVISNLVFSQDSARLNPVGASDFVWQWGQFVDHDIDLTEGTNPPENYPIDVPTGDPQFDPNGLGNQLMPFNRSVYTHDRKGIRQQLNEITSLIDASNVYGSDATRLAALRMLDGSGRMKVGERDLLPNNDGGLPNAGGDSALLFLAGDVRANEQVALTALHTLFVREHNRWIDILRSKHPNASGDKLFARARALVTAEIQHITYNEFLPVLLGRNHISRYAGYKRGTDARIMNVFSTAAFRLGHSMLSPNLLRLDAEGQPIAAGNLPLRNAFFAPDQIRSYGIDSLLRGMARQRCEAVDSFVVDDVRNFLFGAPGHGGFDLVSLNIQRGRDHGLPSYNNARRALGLRAAKEFSDISSDPDVAQRLQLVYTSVEDVDIWVGGMAEDRYRDGMLGQLFRILVKTQFEALRDGDPRWYLLSLNRRERRLIRSLRLSDIIRLNTGIGNELNDDVFRVPTE